MSEWISVDDKLPVKNHRVIAYDQFGFGVVSARMNSAGWYIEGDLDQNDNVTHWMELPEPPNQA